jgi:hypothetical protein
MKLARMIKNKGVPWTLTNLLYLRDFGNELNCSRLHFLNGRYTVTKKTFENTRFLKLNSLNIKFKKSNVSTIYFFFNMPDKKKIFFHFKIGYILSLIGFSVEDIFCISWHDIKYLDLLGVHGKINGINLNQE